MTIAKPSGQHCLNSRGFTLVEVMVSLAIMTMILAIAYSGLSVALNAWDRGGDAIDDLDRRFVVERLLRRQLAMAYPMEFTINGEKRILFRGSSGRVEFIADYSLAAGAGAFQKIDYAVDGGRFLYGETPLFGYEPAETESLPATVLAGFKEISFSFLGQDQQGNPLWIEEWELGMGVPAAIRVRIDADTFIVRPANR